MNTLTLRCFPTPGVCREFPQIRAVLFDKDGTLAQSQDFLRSLAVRRARLVDGQVPGVQEPLLLAFGVEGDRIHPGGLMAVGSRRDNEIAAAAYVAETGRDWFGALALVEHAFAEADRDAQIPHSPNPTQRKAQQTPLFAPARPLLQTLAEAGIALGIISGDTTENVAAFVTEYGLQDWIALAWGVDRPPAKPDRACFLAACQALGVAPEETVMVGDATGDMAMGRSAGAAACIGVTWGWSQPPTLPQADVVLSQWDQWHWA